MKKNKTLEHKEKFFKSFINVCEFIKIDPVEAFSKMQSTHMNDFLSLLKKSHDDANRYIIPINERAWVIK